MKQLKNRWPIMVIVMGWILLMLATGLAGQSGRENTAEANTPTEQSFITTNITETIYLPTILKPPAPPNPNNILFLSERGQTGTYDVYAMPTNGSTVTQLTNSAFPWDGFYIHSNNSFATARWSPDGQRIAYRDNHRLYIMDWNGSNNQLIFADATLSVTGVPVWSPDGQQIAFIGFKCSVPDCSGSTSTGSGLVLVNLNSQQTTLLVENTQLDPNLGLHWTADGQYILAKELAPGVILMGILSIPTNGTPPATLFSNYFIQKISISPSRTQIAFIAEEVLLYVGNADGTGTPIEIFNGFNVGETPFGVLWRLDNQQLLIESYTQTERKLYTVAPNGQNLQPLVIPQLAQLFYAHSWTADNRILFSSGSGIGQGGLDIYTMNPDGSGILNLTADNSRMDYPIDYRP
jgi:dipeptidyl aminopeptidase/acylaminoacyl peptidase